MQKTVMIANRGIRLFFCFLLFIFAVIPGGCESGSPSIRIDAPEATLSPMFPGAASVFLHIVNTGKASDRLVDAGLDISGVVVELHDVKDGRMVKAESIRIPAGETVQLKPGGLHIMIFKLPATIKAGADIGLVLQFEQSGERRVAVRLRDNASKADKGHGK